MKIINYCLQTQANKTKIRMSKTIDQTLKNSSFMLNLIHIWLLVMLYNFFRH